MPELRLLWCLSVICRIGSLESYPKRIWQRPRVICRIGSLEILACRRSTADTVICRIGSLEIVLSLLA